MDFFINTAITAPDRAERVAVTGQAAGGEVKQ